MDELMATEKQIAANRANAKRSSGPQTPEGKIRSSMNSRKHGLSAKTIVIDGEDPAEFEQLLNDLIKDFDPHPGCENELVYELATQLWRLSRIPALEASLRPPQDESARRDPRIEKLIELEKRRSKICHEITIEHLPRRGAPETEDDKRIRENNDDKRIRSCYEEDFPPLQKNEMSSEEHIEALLRLSRYQTRLVNSIEGTLNMLLAFQHMRAKHEGRFEPPLQDIALDGQKPDSTHPDHATESSAKLIVIDDEDLAEFERLHADLVGQFKPWRGAECQLVLVTATIFFRLRRIPRLEASLINPQRESAYRDPRVDKRIESELKCLQITKEMGVGIREAHAKVGLKISGMDGDPDEALNRAQSEYEKLLIPKSNQPEVDPAASRELLVKISSYESALKRSLTRVIKILVGLQNIRSEPPRALTQS
jgi:hypothetical protein